MSHLSQGNFFRQFGDGCPSGLRDHVGFYTVWRRFGIGEGESLHGLILNERVWPPWYENGCCRTVRGKEQGGSECCGDLGWIQ